MAERELRSSRNEKEERAIYFHPKQIEYIESIFPEIVLPSTVSEAAIREYMGTRKVVHFLRSKCKAE